MSIPTTNALRDTIRNENDLNALREQLKSTLTLTQVKELLVHVLRDDVINDAVTRAIGLKGDKTIKQRAADALAATMLGFPNSNAMFAYYRVTYYELLLFRHMTPDGETQPRITVEQGVMPGVFDLCYAYPDEFYFKFDEELFEFEYLNTEREDMSKEEAKRCPSRYGFTAASPLTGMAFDMAVVSDWETRMKRCHRCKEATPAYFNEAMAYMVEMAGVGISFPIIDEPLNREFTGQDVAVIAIDQAVTEGVDQVVIGLGEQILSAFPERVEALGGRVMLDDMLRGAARIASARQVTTVAQGDMTLHVDYTGGTLVFAKEDKPVLGGGLYVDPEDKRYKRYLSHTK